MFGFSKKEKETKRNKKETKRQKRNDRKEKNKRDYFGFDYDKIIDGSYFNDRDD